MKYPEYGLKRKKKVEEEEIKNRKIMNNYIYVKLWRVHMIY